MAKKTRSASQLNSSEVDQLLVLCEEVMRATPDGALRFVEPAAGVLSRAKSKQHNIVFGRRGSGKSSLLRKTAADLTVDRRPIAFVDMETFKGHSYPDVLISVLIKSLYEFETWLTDVATTPATKKSFWRRFFGTTPNRPPFNRVKTELLKQTLRELITDLESQLRAPEVSAEQVKKTESNDSSMGAEVGAKIGAVGASVDAKVSSSDKHVISAEYQSKYVSHKVEYLHQNIIRFQKFFKDLATLSSGSAFLILDDLYHIRKSDQAKVIDYFHRIAKSNNVWLKIGTIKHRSRWYEHSDPPVGMKLGDDAKEIDLDMSLEKFMILQQFLRKILSDLMSETPPITIKELMNPTAIDRLIIASGGVTRDFIGIFSNSINQARNRNENNHRGPKIGAEDVNLGTGDYYPVKREEFKLDSSDDREYLDSAFEDLIDFCTNKSKCNIFLINQKMDGLPRDAINQLIDLRLIHPVKSRVTLKAGAAGLLFEAYMLDLSQYTASRKVHKFVMIDLSDENKDELIRRSSLIYGGYKS
jgi:hypothetical protein